MQNTEKNNGINLYDEMIRLYKENKENIISDRNILVMDQHFEGITGITRSVLSSIKIGIEKQHYLGVKSRE